MSVPPIAFFTTRNEIVDIKWIGDAAKRNTLRLIFNITVNYWVVVRIPLAVFNKRGVAVMAPATRFGEDGGSKLSTNFWSRHRARASL